jgi:hypothetical protein
VIWPLLFDTVKWPLGERQPSGVHPQAGTGAPAGLLVELQGDVVRGDENIWVNARVRIVKKMRFVRTQRKPTTDATSTAHALPDTG